MQISKTYKKRFVAVMVLFAMLLGTGYVVGEFLRPVHYETDLYNAEYQEMKNNKAHVDLVFLGASGIQKACDPKVFEEKLSLDRVFNLSMAQLDMQGCYFQLKEFIEEFHPKMVVLSLTYSRFMKKTTPMIVKLRVMERLHGSNCASYIKNNFSVNEYSNIIPLYGYRGNIGNIWHNTEKRIQYSINDIYVKDKGREYKGQGFVSLFRSVPLGNMDIRKVKGFDKTMIREDSIYYLDKCVQLCKDNNVQLFFMTPPQSMAYIYNVGNYQDLVDYISDYAKKNNIVYHNLSYLKGREEWFPDSMMFDDKHINVTGSEIVGEKYAEILLKSLNHIDTSNYFYSSLAEMQESVHRVVAVNSRPVIKNNVMSLNIESLQNKDVTPSYQVLLARKNNDFKPIVDWTTNKKVSFKIPKGSQYRILLRARDKESDSYYAWKAWEVDKSGKARIIQDVPAAVYNS